MDSAPSKPPRALAATAAPVVTPTALVMQSDVATDSCGTYVAMHNFTATHGDELTFERGDVITVTQKLEGGWWEGRLAGQTGWFPSNHLAATEDALASRAEDGAAQSEQGDRMSASDDASRAAMLPPAISSRSSSVTAYRGFVARRILDSERTYISEILSVKVRDWPCSCPQKASAC